MVDSQIISVTLMTGCYRRIQISESAGLYQLHMAIQETLPFDNDYLLLENC